MRHRPRLVTAAADRSRLGKLASPHDHRVPAGAGVKTVREVSATGHHMIPCMTWTIWTYGYHERSAGAGKVPLLSIVRTPVPVPDGRRGVYSVPPRARTLLGKIISLSLDDVERGAS